MKKLAYIGVDGRKYRILSPIKKIYLTKVENGYAEWDFEGRGALDAARTRLSTESRLLKDSDNYVKFDFKVFWEHDFEDQPATYEGRYDLTKNDWHVDLGGQMYETILARDNSRSNMFLQNYQTKSMTVNADDSYMVVWDFRQYTTDLYLLQKLL